MSDDMNAGWKLVKYPHYLLLSGGELETGEDVIDKANDMLGHKFGDNLAVLKLNGSDRSYYAIYDDKAPANRLGLREWAKIEYKSDSEPYYDIAEDDYSGFLEYLNQRQEKLEKASNILIKIGIPAMLSVGLLSLILLLVNMNVAVTLALLVIAVLLNISIVHDSLEKNILDMMYHINTTETKDNKSYRSTVYMIDCEAAETDKGKKHLAKALIKKIKKKANIKIDYKIVNGKLIIEIIDFNSPTDKTYKYDKDEAIRHLASESLLNATQLQDVDRNQSAEFIVDNHKSTINDTKLDSLQESITNLEESRLASRTISERTSQLVKNFKNRRDSHPANLEEYNALIGNLERIKSMLGTVSTSEEESIIRDVDSIILQSKSKERG